MLLPEAGRLADVIIARLDVEGRQALLGELELVRAVEAAVFGTLVCQHHAALCARGGCKRIVKVRVPQAYHLHVAGVAPEVHPIDVDIRQGIAQRMERVARVELRPQQTALLAGGSDEKYRSTRWHRQRAKRARQFQQGRHAGGIIERTVKYLLVLGPRQPGVPAKVVPMRGVQHVLVLEGGIRALDQANHVA